MKRGLTLKKGKIDNRASTSTARENSDLITDLNFPEPSQGNVTLQQLMKGKGGGGGISADPTPRRHSQLSHHIPPPKEHNFD